MWKLKVLPKYALYFLIQAFTISALILVCAQIFEWKVPNSMFGIGALPAAVATGVRYANRENEFLSRWQNLLLTCFSAALLCLVLFLKFGSIVAYVGITSGIDNALAEWGRMKAGLPALTAILIIALPIHLLQQLFGFGVLARAAYRVGHATGILRN